MKWLAEGVRFVENLIGDLLFIVVDAAWNLFDRHAENAWTWDEDEEVL